MARLTPRDIQEKEFRSGLRGYKEEEVDEFLDRVTASYEEVFKENIDLKEEVERLMEENKKYELIGERMQAALVAAQETADDVRKNAAKEAENILREAEIKAHKMVQESRDQHRELQKSLAIVKQTEEEFRFKLKSMLQSYLKLLDEVALGDTKEIRKLILPEDMAALDERRRRMEGQEEEAARKATEALDAAIKAGTQPSMPIALPQEGAEKEAPEKEAPKEAAEKEAPKEAAEKERAKPASAEATAGKEKPEKEAAKPVEKPEPASATADKAAEDTAARKARTAVTKAQAAAILDEMAAKASEEKPPGKEPEASMSKAGLKKEVEKPATESTADKSMSADTTAEKIPAKPVEKAVEKPAEKPAAAETGAEKPDKSEEPKKGEKTGLDDIEIKEDESFWKDI